MQMEVVPQINLIRHEALLHRIFTSLFRFQWTTKPAKLYICSRARESGASFSDMMGGWQPGNRSAINTDVHTLWKGKMSAWKGLQALFLSSQTLLGGR